MGVHKFVYEKYDLNSCIDDPRDREREDENKGVSHNSHPMSRIGEGDKDS